MATAFTGLLIGALALFVANLALGSWPDEVKTVTAAIELSTTIIGYVSLAVGLGAATKKAVDKGGVSALAIQEAAGPAVFAIAGAILLIA